MESRDEFIKLIRQLVDGGMKMIQISYRLGVTYTTVFNWNKGISVPANSFAEEKLPILKALIAGEPIPSPFFVNPEKPPEEIPQFGTVVINEGENISMCKYRGDSFYENEDTIRYVDESNAEHVWVKANIKGWSRN